VTVTDAHDVPRGRRLHARTAALLPILCVLCGCAGVPEGAERAEQEGKVAEVVLRDLLSPETAGGFAGTSVVCIELYGSDPDKELLKRLSDQPRPVRKGSACGWDGGRPYYRQVVETSSGLPAVILRVDAVTWLSGHEVTVAAGYESCDLCGAAYTYDLTLEEGRWTVRNRTLKAVA
jgi:hypothetical protein